MILIRFCILIESNSVSLGFKISKNLNIINDLYIFHISFIFLKIHSIEPVQKVVYIVKDSDGVEHKNNYI